MPSRTSLSSAAVCSMLACFSSSGDRNSFSPARYSMYASAHSWGTTLSTSQGRCGEFVVQVTGQKRRLPVTSRRKPSPLLVLPTMMHCRGWSSTL